jgi:hypothetical protein
MPIGREPTPKELITDFQATQLCIREILLYSFLKKHNIDLVEAEVFFK